MADRYTVSDHFGERATTVTLSFEHHGEPVFPNIEAEILDVIKQHLRSKDPESPQSVVAKAYTTVVTEV
ncbi:hypothetical protein [Streptomyces rochei]|uniref:hypothetical protein n=1 Tax=Streptomyces rochei TaxID=1928 RepID=UPI0037009A99